MNMKIYIFRICLFMTYLFTSMRMIAQVSNELSALLPMPNHIEKGSNSSTFEFTAHTVLNTNLPESAYFYKEELQRILKERMGITLSENKSVAEQTVELILDSSIEGKEHYILEVNKHSVSIKASTEIGIYYGLKTLDQLLLGDVYRTSCHKLAFIRIDDKPRFGHRALMLDPARNFLPVQDVKFYIEQMARFKFNVLQLHLTDDQGWRIEIKSHPELTQVGAFRNSNVDKKEEPDNGFYTQEQLRDLVSFAAIRGVEIIPEIDVPGHTVSVLAAYQELGCTHMQRAKKIVGKTVNMMLCASNSKVYELYDDIIREVAGIFPSSQIHLGGDEAAISQNWGKCNLCQDLKKKLGYQQDRQLMNYFFQRIFTSVRKYGKRPTLWCELDNIHMPAYEYLFDYPDDVTLITWRLGLTPKCIELTDKYGHQLIVAPGEYAYLDYPQLEGDLPEFNNWGMPITTLQKCYEFDPGYGLPLEKQKNILGVMGTLWGEAIKDINRLTYMTYPRGLAIAEAGWTLMSYRNWQSFQKRMYPNLMNLMLHGVSYRVPFEVLPRESY